MNQSHQINVDALADDRAPLRQRIAERVGPAAIAEFALDRLYERRRKAAETDPRWRAIEDRREPATGGMRIFLSEHLTIADWTEQNEIEDAITPDPWWASTARFVSGKPVEAAVRKLKRYRQRAEKGYDDVDVWNLNSSLCARLATKLDELADIGNGWPGPGSDWETFEEWTAALRSTASDLRRYNGSAATEEAANVGYAMASGREASMEEIRAAWAHHRALEDQDREAAKKALHWVADNLDCLWD